MNNRPYPIFLLRVQVRGVIEFAHSLYPSTNYELRNTTMGMLRRTIARLAPLALTTSSLLSVIPVAQAAFVRSAPAFPRQQSTFHPSSSSQLRMSSTDVIPGRPTWQQTMLRIKDPAKTLPFYTDLLGFTLIDKMDFPQWTFSLYFLTTLPEGETYDLTPGTKEAHDYLWTMEGVALELTHNHGTETDAEFKGYHAGNEEKDGFGHVAVK
jgi:lactoylglutathione lyase